jgi:hypothetical protein
VGIESKGGFARRVIFSRSGGDLRKVTVRTVPATLSAVELTSVTELASEKRSYKDNA